MATTVTDRTALVRSNPSSAKRRLLALGALSLALYALTYLMERALARNEVQAWPNILESPFAAPSVPLLLLHALIYLIATLAIFWCYLAVLSMCRSGELQGRTRAWALAMPVLINLLLLPMVPRLSQDVFSYLAHGLLGVIPGDNPLTQPADAVRDAVVGAGLVEYGWHTYPGITPYGILWTRIEVAIAALSHGNVFAAMLLFKAVAVAASLGSGALIWRVLGRINPRLQLFGTLAYLWNPLVLMEFAGEGHNDALMIFFVLAALLACVGARPAASVAAQLLGALTKYVPVLFLPSQLMFLWRRRGAGTRALILEVVTAAVLTAGLAVLLYARFWHGFHDSFFGIVRRQVPNGLASLFGAVGLVLRRTPLKPISDALRALLLTAPLLLYVAWSSWRVRDARELTRAWAWASVIFLLVSSPDYWPWYATMPIALMCAADSEEFLWLVLLLSITGRVAAPSELVHDRGYFGIKASKAIITGIGSFLPLALLCLRQWRQWRRGRVGRPGWLAWRLGWDQTEATPQARRLP
jgi:hypothetical protein